MISLEDVIKNEEVQAFVNASQKQLEALGYTEHSNRHIGIESKRTGEILQKLGFTERTIELGKIAGYLHDIGNCVNRIDHAHTGAILAYNILKEMGMSADERTEIMMAIGNHDEKTGTAVSGISAALILADKSDVHRDRVVNTNMSTFDKHDKVNYAVTNAEFKIDKGNYIKVPNGIAHYIEHLMFNTENGSAFDFFSKLGSSVNAFTSYDITCYEVFSSTYFKENLNYLLDYVNTPYFTKELVNNERGIITEEIKMYESNPNTELTYKAYSNIFINDNRKNYISGNVDDIKKITVDNIFDCYNTFYNPNNMFIVITGNVNPYEALAIIEENMKDKEYNNVEINKKQINELIKVNKTIDTIEMNVEINKVSISYKIPKKNFKSLTISDIELKIYISLLFNILFGVTSDIQDKLMTSKVISTGININKTYTKDYIIISLTTETEYPETLINMVKKDFNSIDDNSITYL